MKYYSTNHTAPEVTLGEAVVRGLAPDKGLYMPEQIEKLPRSFYDGIASMSFHEIACRVAEAFFGDDIEHETLRKIVCDTLSFETPVVRVEPGIYSLELFHGPTLAFKDVGARFMARMLSHFIGRDNGRVSVLVATSGDTGSAVANVSSTGVLTIPMMKKVGYRPHVAGAIEAAASTGGQIMPPIMGAVAFLMAEFTQIPYLTIVTVATGPIILYYITLMAFIHFEAKKHNIGQMKDHHIPSARTVCREGWHFFVAIMVIIVIMAFGYSPGMSALGGIITLIVIHSIKSRKVDFKMLYEAMVLGGRYSLGIGSLVGCIGIILSLVGLTGVGLKLSWLFTTLANGSPLVAILLVGLISMILGMGLASGPAYIVTAIAVGPALADMGFPLMTAHFIMMWFSIDSEITPPVGLASIVGAGIANADPMKTMFTAFKYAKALYILPILFYYRPALLLQSNLFDIALTFVTVMLGLIAFAAVWENYLMRRTTLLERLLLLSGALLLFIPGQIWDFAGIGLFIIVYCLQRYYCPAGFRQTA